MCYEVIAGETEHYGPTSTHVQTFITKMNLANLLDDERTPESIAEAKKLFCAVVEGFTESTTGLTMSTH